MGVNAETYSADALTYEPTLHGPKNTKVHVHKDKDGQLWAHLPWGITLDRKGRESYTTVVVPLRVDGTKEWNPTLSLRDSYLARDNLNQLYRLWVTYPDVGKGSTA